MPRTSTLPWTNSSPDNPSFTCNRRQAMASAIAAATLAASTQPMSAAESAVNLDQHPLIDAHVHVWTPNTARYPLATGFKKADMQPPSFTPK